MQKHKNKTNFREKMIRRIKFEKQILQAHLSALKRPCPLPSLGSNRPWRVFSSESAFLVPPAQKTANSSNRTAFWTAPKPDLCIALGGRKNFVLPPFLFPKEFVFERDVRRVCLRQNLSLHLSGASARSGESASHPNRHRPTKLEFQSRRANVDRCVLVSINYDINTALQYYYY